MQIRLPSQIFISPVLPDDEMKGNQGRHAENEDADTDPHNPRIGENIEEQPDRCADSASHSHPAYHSPVHRARQNRQHQDRYHQRESNIDMDRDLRRIDQAEQRRGDDRKTKADPGLQDGCHQDDARGQEKRLSHVISWPLSVLFVCSFFAGGHSHGPSFFKSADAQSLGAVDAA
jgi:hypothetical protein